MSDTPSLSPSRQEQLKALVDNAIAQGVESYADLHVLAEYACEVGVSSERERLKGLVAKWRAKETTFAAWKFAADELDDALAAPSSAVPAAEEGECRWCGIVHVGGPENCARCDS